ncbi:MAG: hypothetical protein WC356_05860 [Candidatus Micrarchaeia archaeon]|jgi:amino acid transporter
MPVLKNKKTQKKKTTKRKTTIKKNIRKKIDKKEILRQKPFSEDLPRKKEAGLNIMVLPIIFFVLTLIAFGYSIYMPNGQFTELMPIIGFICFVLFIATFIRSMMRLNKC